MTLNQLQSRVESLAAKHGWSVDDGDGYSRWRWARETASRYTTLTRCRLDPDNGPGDDYEEYQTIKVRISDHPTAYCSEDVSLVINGGGPDDHTLATLAAMLAAEFAAT